jgi:hypothetical protein
MARMDAIRSRAGNADGFNADDPLSKKPNSRKLMTSPSISRWRATVCAEISPLQRLLQLCLQRV